MPSGWVRVWDQSQSRHYYFNRDTHETTWDITVWCVKKTNTERKTSEKKAHLSHYSSVCNPIQFLDITVWCNKENHVSVSFNGQNREIHHHYLLTYQLTTDWLWVTSASFCVLIHFFLIFRVLFINLHFDSINCALISNNYGALQCTAVERVSLGSIPTQQLQLRTSSYYVQ